MPEVIRAFIAIELPDSLRASLRKLQTGLQDRVPARTVRWVAPRGIHLTLKFLGSTRVDQIEGIAGDLTKACAPLPSFTYSVGGLGCFPNPHRPRVIWVGIQEPAGALSRLQGAIDEVCSQWGFKREERAFHPHLTLGRTRDRISSGERRAIGDLVQETDVPSLGTMAAEGISLIRSDLRPSGAVYTTLREIGLKES
jgi:2'-5' RNA ligase